MSSCHFQLINRTITKDIQAVLQSPEIQLGTGLRLMQFSKAYLHEGVFLGGCMSL